MNQKYQAHHLEIPAGEEETKSKCLTGTGHPGTGHPGTRLIALLFIGLLLTAGGGVIYGPALMASNNQEKVAAAPVRPPMVVETAMVRVASSDQIISAVGNLISKESVMITAEIAGRIEKIGFAEGEQGKEGTMLIQLDDTVLQAELDRSEASRNLSEVNYKRTEILLKDSAVSVRERDEAYAKWQLDEANLRLAKAQLAKTTIRAPFTGAMGFRQVSLGDYVQPGQPLVTLASIEELKVEFKVPERYFAEVKVAQKVTLTSDAYPGQDFIGKVYAIAPLVEEDSRSLVVRGLIDNRKRHLLPGQFVKVKLTVATRSDALFIPEQALIPQAQKKLVYTVVDGKAMSVQVETGSRTRGWVEITSGLAAGDLVITGGHQKIGPGSPVKSSPADPALFAKID